jgi:hypothetical protein
VVTDLAISHTLIHPNSLASEACLTVGSIVLQVEVFTIANCDRWLWIPSHWILWREFRLARGEQKVFPLHLSRAIVVAAGELGELMV